MPRDREIFPKLTDYSFGRPIGDTELRVEVQAYRSVLVRGLRGLVGETVSLDLPQPAGGFAKAGRPEIWPANHLLTRKLAGLT